MFAGSHFAFVLALVAAVGELDKDPGPRPIEVQFDAPERCSSAEAFYANLRTRTDRVRQANADEPHATLRVRLSRVHGHWVGELRVIDDRGGTDTRRVQGSTCEDVVQALSLTAALALDPTPQGSTPEITAITDEAASSAQAKPEIAPASPEPPARVVASQEVPTSPQRPMPTTEVSAGPIALVVLSGDFTPGVAVAVRRVLSPRGALRPAVGLSAAYARNDVLGSPHDAEVALAVGGATLCPLRWTAGALTVEPCALGLVGWLRAAGREVTHVSNVDRSWISAGLTLRMAAFLGHGLYLGLEGGVTAPLLKRRFYATSPSNVVAETPTFSPIVGLALTYAR